VVATPIGNRGDLSSRARETLAAVELIAAEDTRHTGQFLGIATPLTALHEHNEAERAGELVARLARGAQIALVADAGTPLVSDPGYRLVAAAAAAGIAIVPVPGACAAIAALSIAGLPTDRFAFEGFLPARAHARRARLAVLAAEPRTLVFYEAPHRIQATLDDLAAAFGDARPAVLARELTKMHETVYREPLGALAARARSDANLTRGEAALVVAGIAAEAAAAPSDADAALDRLLVALLRALPLSAAVEIALEVSGGKRNRLYARALALRDSP
jgi:16S rRNA (cytidine1402-2'-O)-methyltransferase